MIGRNKLIEQILSGQPEYRIKQARNCLYKRLIGDWTQAYTLPLEIRDKLKAAVPLDIKGKTITLPQAIKAILEMEDGLKIESVMLKHKSRNTVCVSSQVGCPLSCLFCHTGKLGFNRNLTTDEITNQVLYFLRLLKDGRQTVTNVVFMGMGEPMLNYSNVVEAIKSLNHPEKFNISARKISVSTAGIPEKIKEFARLGLQVNLAVSLNAPTDNLRSRIMPLNKKYPLDELMDSVKYYLDFTNRKVMFEYVMIEGLNDSQQQARQLAGLLKGLLCVVNLIPYNGSGQLSAPGQEKINQFKGILDGHHIQSTQRYRLGTSIAAACGQLLFKRDNP